MSKEKINLKVSGRSDPHKVSGALFRYVSEDMKVSLTAIGASAVNQAVKSLAISRGLVASSGGDMRFTVGFVDEDVSGDVKTAMRFFVYTDY